MSALEQTQTDSEGGSAAAGPPAENSEDDTALSCPGQVLRCRHGARAGRMSGERGRYVSYLLRLWQEQSSGGLVWRASLEHSSTGERRGFACLADLFAFLEQETVLVDEDRPSLHPQES